MINGLHAYIYGPSTKSKARAKCQLIFGQLKRRLEANDFTNPAMKYQWEVDCCKPFQLTSENNVVDEIPKTSDGSPGELWLFYVCDIFCSDFTATYLDKGQSEISNIELVVGLFHDRGGGGEGRGRGRGGGGGEPM